MEGKEKSETEVRDAIAAALEKDAKGVVSVVLAGPQGLMLHPAPHEIATFAVAVLNEDRKIELVGAPALTVEAKNVHLKRPDDGFVVLRNDAEFLINVPDQWRARPGLCRGDAASQVPKNYAKLAACFGDAQPDIYYGHPVSGPLEYWVGAGTFMATYTRMTTMEAANESGRHAAAAIIYGVGNFATQLGSPGQPGLVGDFPPIWRIEDN